VREKGIPIYNFKKLKLKMPQCQNPKNVTGLGGKTDFHNPKDNHITFIKQTFDNSYKIKNKRFRFS
jgi:hypothetical protein